VILQSTALLSRLSYLLQSLTLDLSRLTLQQLTASSYVGTSRMTPTRCYVAMASRTRNTPRCSHVAVAVFTTAQLISVAVVTYFQSRQHAVARCPITRASTSAAKVRFIATICRRTRVAVPKPTTPTPTHAAKVPFSGDRHQPGNVVAIARTAWRLQCAALILYSGDRLRRTFAVDESRMTVRSRLAVLTERLR